MALPMFTRFGNMRNVMNINNISAIGGALNVKQCSNIISRSYTNSSKEIETLFDDIYEENSDKNMSKAMRIYLQRTREHTKFIEVETLKYELGKRHLANMMGEDPAHFEQEDIDRALQYLLPSGIYDKRARPMMVHPSKIFENKKEAQFDESGRPFHFLYYTCKPNYYEVLRKIAEAIKYLDAKEDEYIEKRRQPLHQNKLDMENTCWITKTAIEAELLEELQPSEYEYLIKCLDRLVEHPMSIHKTDFIMQYRKELQISTQSSKILALEYDSNDRPFVLVPKCKRKCALANVKVIGKGSGNIIINGKDISYFRNVQYREEIIFPLIFTNMSDKVDVEATVSGGGPTGQAGAIRFGIARGLQSFVDEDMIDRMRIAGLLTRDLRRRERKKPGQEGARRKFTWNKR